MTVTFIPRTTFDVFLNIGQSNNYYSSTAWTAGTDGVWNPDVLALGLMPDNAGIASPIVQGVDPLQHVADIQQAQIGYPIAFLRDYYLPNSLAAGHKALMIPSARGSTASTVWAKTSPTNAPGYTPNLYNLAVNRTNAVLAITGATLKGILWLQGESDISAGTAAATYSSFLTTFIANLRADITGATNVPFILGGPPQYWYNVDNFAVGPDYKTLFESIPGLVTYTGYASSTSPTVLGAGNQHFSAVEHRTMAGRYWTAYQAALANH